MTKEELKKEAEEYVKENTPLFNALGKEMTYTYKYMKQAYLAGAEPREKRIAELKKENAELKKACDETQELLDKQIEATYKVVEKLNEAKEILKVVLNKWKEDRWILQSEKEVKMIENVMKEAEAFLEED